MQAGQGVLCYAVVHHLQRLCRADSELPCELALELTHIDDRGAYPACKVFCPAEERIRPVRSAIEHGPSVWGKYTGNVVQPGSRTSQRSGLSCMRAHQVRLQPAQGAPQLNQSRQIEMWSQGA